MKSANQSKFIGFLIKVLVISSLSSFAFATTAAIHPTPASIPTSTPASTDTATPDTDTTKGPQLEETDVSRFTNAIGLINEFYVKPVEEKKLLENAIRGIVAGLDPHSEYLDEDAYKTLLMETSGEFGGIGIEVTGEYDVVKVISPIDDTPAARAGVKPGDYIVAINNKLVSNMTLNEAVAEIHGKKGSSIDLTILRKNADKPIKMTMVRDTIHIDTVKSRMLDNGYGYVRISQFQEPTATLLVKAIDDLQKTSNGQLKGLVLDLRNNPGGLLESAVKVVNVFLDSKNLTQFQKMIVYTKGHLPQLQYQAKADGNDLLKGMPLVILVNEGSASASEIVAGALQDYHRAIIVGNRSFGKGSVQTVIPLDKTHALKLTTALYYTPAGRQIQNSGIKPDVSVENLKVTSTNPDSLILGPIREFELKNHLKGKNGFDGFGKGNGDVSDYTDLAQQDFQLYEALKILQAVYETDNKTLVKN
jgi:carboxyl-terminal processing protease